MRKLNYALIFVLVFGLSLTMLSVVLAQQDTGQAGGNRQNRQNQQQRTQMDPEAMIQQMLGRILEQLKLSDEETTVLKPKIEVIMKTRMAQSQETRALVNSLREAINAKDTDKIKSSLAAIKSKREENKKKTEAMEKDLTDLLTLDQEALLTVSGIVNSDGGGGFFGGFGGPGGPGGNRGNGGTRNQGGNPPQPPQPPQE